MEGRNVAVPIIKWAGSKQQLIKQLEAFLPTDFRRLHTYVEPFVGGGALLFWILNNHAGHFKTIIANDHNADLIRMYRCAQEDVESLIGELRALTSEFRQARDPCAYYLERRKEYNCPLCTDQTRRSALLVFLNRTCFNGLYRVNQKGEFNVPYGQRPLVQIYNAEALRQTSEALKRVHFVCGGYELAGGELESQDGTFYYFDPPYRPLTPTSNFTRYTKEIFGEAEQKKLASHCIDLHRRGAAWMLSNSDTRIKCPGDLFYKTHFEDYGFVIRQVMARRCVNSNAFKRGKIPEVLITSYRINGC